MKTCTTIIIIITALIVGYMIGKMMKRAQPIVSNFVPEPVKSTTIVQSPVRTNIFSGFSNSGINNGGVGNVGTGPR